MTEKQEEITRTLFEKAKTISFGSVSVELKVHAGKCTGVIYTISENTREKKDGEGILD